MSSRKSHIIALVATLLFHAAVVAILCVLYLRYSPAEEAQCTWPPVDSSEVLFGGEYVMIGDTPDPVDNSTTEAPATPSSAEAEPPVAEALVNTGTPSPEPAPVVVSERKSPAKVAKKEVKEPTGPSKAEIEAAERAKREQEKRQEIANRVQFGSAGSGAAGKGKTGSPNGNSDTGAASGKPGFNLNGRTMEQWTTPDRGPLGTITISVNVNRQGKVTSAAYRSGTGAAAASQATRQNCIRAARASQFSVDNNAPASQKGTITYNFR